MRLSQSQAQTIRESVLSNFGEDAHVWLFGSRARDDEKGGDIDLYIEVQAQSAADLITSKLKFLRDLHKRLGDQKSTSCCVRPMARLSYLFIKLPNRPGFSCNDYSHTRDTKNL
jgi:predicted nucleotidyltransferase